MSCIALCCCLTIADRFWRGYTKELKKGSPDLESGCEHQSSESPAFGNRHQDNPDPWLCVPASRLVCLCQNGAWQILVVRQVAFQIFDKPAVSFAVALLRSK